MTSKYSAFRISDFTYKTVNETPLLASVLVPKELKPESGPRPILVHFHGGGLVLGDKLYEEWFPLWLLQLAESKGAIIITPDYRLVPEARGVDILEDVKDFWTWVHNSFPSKVSSALPKDASVDVNKIAACGESAGGYLALQSGFLFPEARIKLIMAQYGTLDIDHPDYNRGPHTVPASGSAVDKYISNLKPGAIRINSPNPDRWDFCMEVLQEGRHHDLIGNEPDLHLMDTMKRAKNIPPIWFAQGTTDEIMPQSVADDFYEAVKKQHPATPVHMTIQPGPHGFDGNTPLDADWVQAGCKFIDGVWP